MTVVVVFSVLLAAAAGGPIVRTWTFPELAYATGNYSGRRTQEELEYLEDAKYEIAESVVNGTSKFVIPSPSGRPVWTFQELKDQNPKPLTEYIDLNNIKTSEEARDFAIGHAISKAYYGLLDNARRYQWRDTIKVTQAGVDISKWSIQDLENGLNNRKTHPALIPYLKDAHPELMEYIRAGYQNESIVILTPIGLIPHHNKLKLKRKSAQGHMSPPTRKIGTLHPKGWPHRRP